MIKTDLKQRRKAQKLSQLHMGIALNCSTKQFRRYENGQCEVPFDKARQWAKTLGLSMNQFDALYK